MNLKHGPVRTYAIAERAAIDMTLSENPLGTSKEVIGAIRKWAAASHQYPVDEKKLVALIARLHGIAEDSILLGAGANGLLEGYLQVLALGKNIVAPAATFPEPVERMATLLGTVSAAPLNADLSVNMAGLPAACSSETCLIHLCNPNNPTGMWESGEKIHKLAKSSPVPVLLSEAGADWIGCTAIGQKMPTNLIVVRSFSKAYGLAGLRIGYSIGHPDIIARMKVSLRSYRVNFLGIVAAIAAFEDQEHLQKSIIYNAVEKAWLMKEMGRLGFAAAPSHGQHFMARVPEQFHDADHFYAAARERGIAVVNCSIYAGLNQYIRISPRNHKTNQMLILFFKTNLRGKMNIQDVNAKDLSLVTYNSGSLKASNPGHSHIYVGIGLWSKRNHLSEGLPVDVMHMLLAAKLVQVTHTNAKVVILIADSMAIREGADSIQTEQIVLIYKKAWSACLGS